MKKIMVLTFATITFMVSACGDETGHVAATGSGGSGAGGASAGSTSSTGGGEPCGGPCPDSPGPCHDVVCVVDSCVLVPAAAGGACGAADGADVCNGSGICGASECTEDSDCGPAPECFSMACAHDGPLANTCVATKISDGICGDVCAPVMRGPAQSECAGIGTVPFMCGREGGPRLGSGICQRPDAQGSPLTWCCDLG
jgi:hypothetical protein